MQKTLHDRMQRYSTLGVAPPSQAQPSFTQAQISSNNSTGLPISGVAGYNNSGGGVGQRTMDSVATTRGYGVSNGVNSKPGGTMNIPPSNKVDRYYWGPEAAPSSLSQRGVSYPRSGSR